MQRDLQIIGDLKLRDEVAEAMFNYDRKGGRMISDVTCNRDYWETLASIAIERIGRK